MGRGEESRPASRCSRPELNSMWCNLRNSCKPPLCFEDINLKIASWEELKGKRFLSKFMSICNVLCVKIWLRKEIALLTHGLTHCQHTSPWAGGQPHLHFASLLCLHKNNRLLSWTVILCMAHTARASCLQMWESRGLGSQQRQRHGQRFLNSWGRGAP